MSVCEKELELPAILHFQGQAVLSEKAHRLDHTLNLFQTGYRGATFHQVSGRNLILVNVQFIVDRRLFTGI
jgi:hypothetical protein